MSSSNAFSESADFKQLAEDITANFGHLNLSQLDWTIDSKRWSIKGCLSHIHKTNMAYRKTWMDLLDKEYRPGFWQRRSPFTRWTGQSMIKQLGPTVERQFKTPRLFMPVMRGKGIETVSETVKGLEQLQSEFEKLEKRGFMDAVVASPVSPLITLRLADIRLILSGHTLRHLNQAKRMHAEPGFPRG